MKQKHYIPHGKQMCLLLLKNVAAPRNIPLPFLLLTLAMTGQIHLFVNNIKLIGPFFYAWNPKNKNKKVLSHHFSLQYR